MSRRLSGPPIPIPPPGGEDGKYLIAIDPLDGSGNVDVAGQMGTIFGIYKRPATGKPVTIEEFYQPGRNLVAAGYVLYGPCTMMVYTAGGPVNGFTLDRSIGTFFLTHPNLKIPEGTGAYSINEANAETFPEGYQKYLRFAHSSGYTSRYIGSMVSDVHRTLIRGGVFIYPPTAKNPDGKLRLLYEANPMAMLIEQAGGLSSSGDQPTMQIQPDRLHQRVPVLLGSPEEVARVREYL